MSFFDNIKEKGQDFINDIKDSTDGIKDFIEDPSKIMEKGLNFVSQDVLDRLIDKVVNESNEEIKESGLDPLSIDDITIPFNLDKIANACGSSNNPLMGILSAFCACLSKTTNLEGDLFLKNGLLSGLSNLSRTMPTKLEVKEGSVRITAGIGVGKLGAPFETSTSIPMSEKFSPEVEALVEKIGIKCGLVIPIMSGAQKDGKVWKLL